MVVAPLSGSVVEIELPRVPVCEIVLRFELVAYVKLNRLEMGFQARPLAGIKFPATFEFRSW